jgi:hypothetical protein
MAAPLKQVTIVPDLPRDPQIVDKDGKFNPVWKVFFEQFIQALQTNFSAQGTVFPQQTASNIALLTTVSSKANILYNSTNDTFMGNVQTSPGVYTWKTFTLT